MKLPTGTPYLECLALPGGRKKLAGDILLYRSQSGQEQADTTLGKLEQIILSLERLPLNDNVAPELEMLSCPSMARIYEMLEAVVISSGYSILDAIWRGSLRKK